MSQLRGGDGDGKTWEALFSNLLTSVKLKKSPMPPTNLSTIPEYSSIIGAHG